MITLDDVFDSCEQENPYCLEWKGKKYRLHYAPDPDYKPWGFVTEDGEGVAVSDLTCKIAQEFRYLKEDK